VKAAVCRAFGAPLQIEELRLDRPGGSEVVVDVAAAAICHSDIAFAEGAWGGELPAVYGHEAAGVVRELGDGVTHVRRGDRVVVGLLRSCGSCFFCLRGEEHLCEGVFDSDGRTRLRDEAGDPVVQAMHTAAFAEEVLVDESQLAVVPDAVALDVASLLGCGVLTGVGVVLDKVGVASGSSVVVVGTGGVGINVVQGAVLAGAGTLVAVDVSPSKRASALAFGATHTLDPADGAVAEARRLTGGRGADYVFVTVGRGDVIEGAVRYARRGGTVVVVGMPPNEETFGVVAVDLAHDDVRILGAKIGSGSGRFADAIERLVRLYEDGRLRLDELITARYPLAEINEAIAAARDGDALRNVVVFDRA
jgi:S-(hydroxymethyl)glutathione dehydrogenase / alcohol dehydrogenase